MLAFDCCFAVVSLVLFVEDPKLWEVVVMAKFLASAHGTVCEAIGWHAQARHSWLLSLVLWPLGIAVAFASL